ncbi:MAG: hypothetical protein JRF59_02830 [Deltaproteobacteria bacterium]|nr:hypothetical protein [Deltaproteobacteria bacterium]MBW1922981.1 hypothetical protein [Deltaproteobacteria bacterium]MBW1949069.1 hypothetical protein [Deltaproteobacteria bacterium]MBW2009587.1 hypothetical protein [Deltaproteobacteria bacterium]MBW2101792.1 hypothetical protein [Deltaproteobacteria bacterium]
MDSEELVQLMKSVEEKGVPWEKVEEELKIKHDLLKLYASSGPVPVTIINGLKKILESGEE